MDNKKHEEEGDESYDQSEHLDKENATEAHPEGLSSRRKVHLIATILVMIGPVVMASKHIWEVQNY